MQTYITSDGDCWDSIAKKVYGKELRADVLMSANTSLLDTFMFDSGTEINVPELTEPLQQERPPWRTQYANASDLA